MCLIYIEEINMKLQMANESHSKLLNGMHEGILILSQSTRTVPARFLFCNFPARKLISTFLGNFDCCKTDQQAFARQREILLANEFTPV